MPEQAWGNTLGKNLIKEAHLSESHLISGEKAPKLSSLSSGREGRSASLFSIAALIGWQALMQICRQLHELHLPSAVGTVFKDRDLLQSGSGSTSQCITEQVQSCSAVSFARVIIFGWHFRALYNPVIPTILDCEMHFIMLLQYRNPLVKFIKVITAPLKVSTEVPD